MRHHVIYIPGLGDTSVAGQRLATNVWWLYGVRPHLFHMDWANGEPFEPKFDRLLMLIDELATHGRVSLVAASAGATVAMNAFAVRPATISGVVCIAGVVNGSRSGGGRSAYAASAAQATLAIPHLKKDARQRILSIRGVVDPIVPAASSILEGAHNQTVRTHGHFTTIAGQLTYGAPHWLRFLKKCVAVQAKQ